MSKGPVLALWESDASGRVGWYPFLLLRCGGENLMEDDVIERVTMTHLNGYPCWWEHSVDGKGCQFVNVWRGRRPEVQCTRCSQIIPLLGESIRLHVQQCGS